MYVRLSAISAECKATGSYIAIIVKSVNSCFRSHFHVYKGADMIVCAGV